MDSESNRPLVRIERDLVAKIQKMDDVHLLMDEYWSTVARNYCCQVDGTWRALFNSAIAEVAGNIVRHAYPEQADGETFHITLQFFKDRAEAELIDHGLPFDFTPPTRQPDMRIALDDLDLDSGWGLPMALAATDSLNYERLPDGHNRWHLDKRLT